ncbi:MAG TPA: protein kinase [Gemmatimonadaceae bacterium]
MGERVNDEISRLGESLADRYRIERELGAGGMATVYLAHDLKHDRNVAIKVLRPELAAVIGAERFLSEIKTTANLQHPHILSLFDSGTVDGTVFYVMPFVDGESLRDRLIREKQLPVRDALGIAREIADALQYAHAHGVIHRDIKPENILLQGGHALVADFGIALAASKVGGNRMTETGMSLGTPQYMSPEQAMGERELDARTDIYALGCVTFEMLAGEPPFTGPTAQSIVAKVITAAAPPIRSKRDTVPEHVSEAIQIALQKTPADRFGSAAEFATALESPNATASRRAPAGVPRSSTRLRAGMVGAMVLVAIASFLLGGKLLGRRVAPPLVFGRAAHVTWEQGLEITPALSPDGRSVAYAAGPLVAMHVMVKPVGEGRAILLTDDTTSAETDPQWSADGSRILYLTHGGVSSAPAAGGAARPEIPGDTASAVTSAVWSTDNRIAFTRADSLFVRETDGTLHGIARIPQATRCAWSPNARFIACAAGDQYYAAAGTLFGNQSPSWVVVARVGDGRLTTVTDTLSLNHSPAWSADGRWLYFVSNRDGPNDIYGVPLESNGDVGGAVQRLSTGLGAHTISVSNSGSRVAYSRYSAHTSLWSIPLPANPPVTTTAAVRITNANEIIEAVSISADGKWLYYDSNLSGNVDIFRVPAGGGEPERLTTDPADDFAPSPSPDGREIVFHSWRGGSRDIYVMRLDGGGVQRVTDTPQQEALARWTPDGKGLVYTNMTPPHGIWLARRDDSGHWGKPRRMVATGFFPFVSPDGHWLAFTDDVYSKRLEAIPTDSGPTRTIGIGMGAASWATWAPDGLIYFSLHDTRGNASIWTTAPATGATRLIVRLDPLLHSSLRTTFAVGNGRIYFSADDNQSDVWVMDTRRR